MELSRLSHVPLVEQIKNVRQNGFLAPHQNCKAHDRIDEIRTRATLLTSSQSSIS